MGDEAAKIFLNASGTKGDIHPPLKEFLDYVAGREPENPSEFIVKLKTALHHAKQNREWRREHMIWYFKEQDIRADALREGIDIGRQEGIDIGRQESRTDGIFAMISLCLEDGLSQKHIMQKLQKHFHITPETAQEYFERYQKAHS